VHIDNILRPADALQGPIEGAPVHAFRLWNVVADSALAADFIA
jgi:hypothetical protein